MCVRDCDVAKVDIAYGDRGVVVIQLVINVLGEILYQVGGDVDDLGAEYRRIWNVAHIACQRRHNGLMAHGVAGFRIEECKRCSEDVLYGVERFKVH